MSVPDYDNALNSTVVQFRNASPVFVVSSNPGVDMVLGSSELRFSSPASTTLTLRPKWL